MEPIERFKDVEQIKEYAKYYIELLGLQDWNIVFLFTDDFNTDLSGLNSTFYTDKIAQIKIRKTLPEKDLIIKEFAELTLIHELLHCKFINFDNGSYESTQLEQQQHTLLHDMAKAIFNARYGLTIKDYYLE